MTPDDATNPTHATIATHILRAVWNELTGVYVPGYCRSAYSLGFRPGELLVHTGDGYLIEISARVLPSDDPRVVAMKGKG